MSKSTTIFYCLFNMFIYLYNFFNDPDYPSLAYAKAHRDEICPGYLDCLITDRATQLATALTKAEAYTALTPDSFA